MDRTTVALVFVLSVFSSALHAQGLDDSAIATTIKAGVDNKFDAWTARCRAEASPSERRRWSGPMRPTGSYDIVLSTNLGAIAFFAHLAKEDGIALGVSQVPPPFLNPAVVVFVEPRKPPSGTWSLRPRAATEREVPSQIEQIVLNSRAASSVASKPEHIRIVDRSFPGLGWYQIGPDGRPRHPVFEKSRGFATFPIESVKRLPPGDLEIVVVTKHGERRCEIRSKDRTRLFP
jgi:hypothetical protein